MSRRSVVRVLLVAYLGAALVLTLLPRDFQKDGRNTAATVGVIDRPQSIEEAERQADLTDRAVNIFMLMPLAALIALGGRKRTLVAIAACSTVSAAIEVAQRLLATNRAGELRDFLLNVAGAGVGASLTGLVVALKVAKSSGTSDSPGRGRFQR